MSRSQQKYHTRLTTLCRLITIAAILFGLVTYGFAQTQPRLMNFQGKLTDQQGQILEGTYTVIFSLYATATGGTALWTERHENLSISNGLVNALLGSIQSFDDPQKVDFDAPRYLGITIDVDNNENSPDPEMLPRQRITSALFAHNADKANEAEVLTGDQTLFFVPKGGIIMWSGTLADIPQGWALCNGINGTPDLRNKFIRGTPSGTNPGGKGGADSYSLSVAQLPPHSHSGSASGNHSHSASVSPNPHKHSLGLHSHYSNIHYEGTSPLLWPEWADIYKDSGGTNLSVSIGNNGSHSHSSSIIGSGNSIDNKPAYFALAFIMKL